MKDTASNARLATVDAISPSTHEVADETLAEAARGGDHAAFDQIFERHRRRVARLAGRFFNRPERVEEMLQEVFTKVYFSLDAYSADRGHSFAAWLTRVTINACYDELRRARRRPEGSISDITTEEAEWLNVQVQGKQRNAESALISRDLANKLLARLSAEDRVVLTLLEAEELTVAEIAVVMGWKISKVKVRAHRARHSLRKVLGEFL
jgi:RNA polymerase sigma-70 factor (ECF subfamily)